jgi:LysM repeat protein
MDPRRIVIVVLLALGLSGCVTKENYNAQILRTNNFQRLLSEEEKRTVELSTEIARLKDQMASMETKNKALTAQLNDSKAQVVRSLEEVGRLQDEVKQSRGGFSSVPALRGPSQEPPDRLGELQEKPAAPSEKKGDKKKGKAEAKVKVGKVAPPAQTPPAPFEPLLREPSQEPPDRLGELQAAPAAVKSEKKVEKPAEKPVARQKGKATAKIRVQKQSEEPSSPPPKVEAPPPPAKAEAKAKAQAKTETEAQAKPETEAAPDDSFFRYHKVKKGETLAGIAKQYRTDAQTLRELNDLASGDAVKPGDRLIVGQKQ